ncbi:hypothetical protein B0A48_15871 [Cryoendolithus antarcticus]|uniref:General transcription and DNA repair factor IIH subunit TFB5 n=1 Tax=Cryoendolithus antarcticus TaxID=1507870 RepID=A0A1V8SAD5_9PEZI|nr:hypothetical protein B0A48_17737 [Cryoendolithus antarcticus]OQN98608.1 hypothetical protein B0A48_15871 [Cryoendolithus antarcticus]OQO11983.1 hypothetical protein B0A51_16516 [Rachicladosporium sp. CCFEE 5018]OQO20182.1 hypothetical protein B0A51_11684 [Rachicladosporium sp. CCFEE 5018]
MPRAQPGVLVETDASIHAIIVRIDTEHRNKFILENIDDENLLIHRDNYEELKQLLHDRLKHAVREAEESSDSD